MKSEDLRDVMIDDEWVVALDYGQMAVRLAYSLAKAPIHFDDGYLIPRREWAREATKKLINIMLNSPDAKNWSVPKKVRDYYKDQDVQKRLIEEIKSFHKPIEHLFGKPNGMKFMFLESEILIDVLLELNSQGILALPIHDGLLVKPSQQDIAKQVMLKVFKKHTNLVATVSIENL